MDARIDAANSDLERLHAERASAWIELLRQATPAQKAEFVAWLKESPANVREILCMLAVDNALDSVDAGHLNDTRALVEQINSQVVPFPNRRGHAPSLVRSRSRRWMAAGLAALIACSAYFLIHDRVGWQEYRTATSEQRAFVLADGSVVHLNTQSRIAVRLTPAARDVRFVEGEALFRVHHDASRPFRVHTGNAEIEDVGTQFNVRDRPDGTFIAVIEGRVNVAPIARQAGTAAPDSGSQGGSAEVHALTANQEAQVSPVGSVSIRTMTDVSDAVAWRGRRLVFREEPLERIAEEFNRYNPGGIRLKDPAVAKRVFTGVFDADDTDSLLQVLERDPNLRVEKTEQGISIGSRP